VGSYLPLEQNIGFVKRSNHDRLMDMLCSHSLNDDVLQLPELDHIEGNV